MSNDLYEVEGSRWMPFKDGTRPRPGEVFAGQHGSKIYPRLFLMQEGGKVVYLDSRGTQLGSPWDFFTEWMLVARLSSPRSVSVI